MVIEISIGKGRPVKAAQSSKLSNELGIIAQNLLMLPNKWRELTKEEKDTALIRCHGEEHEGVKPDRIDFYKNTHYSTEKGWSSEQTEANYLGYGPKPDTTRAIQRRAAELEDSLKKVKEKAVTSQHDLQK
ncbi:putative splicing factor, arginine/serine-rich 15-like [Capsicum annuum]|nr:putative splicing factor, arginine/serine-rich 15-like [Capsicum annuum]